MKIFNTLADLQAARFASTGQLVQVKGTDTTGDGGIDFFLIQNSGTPDGVDVFATAGGKIAVRQKGAKASLLAGRAKVTDTTQFATGTTTEGVVANDATWLSLVGTTITVETQGFHSGSTVGGAKYKFLNGADSAAAGYVDGYSRFQIRGLDVYACLVVGDNLPYISSLGATEVNAANSAIMQIAIDTFGGFIIDIDFNFSQPIDLPETGAKIHCDGVRRTLTWEGDDFTFAISTSNTGGSYQNEFKGFTLHSNLDNKYGLDHYRLRYSHFERVYITGMLKAARTCSSWNSYWEDCWFSNLRGEVGSIGMDFEFIIGEPYNITNAAKFVRCHFSDNTTGIRLESMGDGIHFDNCGIEANTGYGISITGVGNCHSLIFDGGCYVEYNTLGPIEFNKTGAGFINGFVFRDNYVGMDSTARAGIVEFKANNGGEHQLKFENNTFRDFGGIPSEGVLLDVNGANMGNIYIEWFNNIPYNIAVNQFDKDSVDWRYIKTDVRLKLTYSTNPFSTNPFTSAYTNGELFLSVPNFGEARIVGSFVDSTNGSTAAINVTDALPPTLEPSGLVSFPAIRQIDASTSGAVATIMLNGGRIRMVGVLNEPINVDFSYSLNVVKTSKGIVE